MKINVCTECHGGFIEEFFLSSAQYIEVNGRNTTSTKISIAEAKLLRNNRSLISNTSVLLPYGGKIGLDQVLALSPYLIVVVLLSKMPITLLKYGEQDERIEMLL